ncbi:MAG: FG-GAP repeat protein, partial [Deltaproteobacteria bacterium]|nr:FG-GAP repeat protein [Deltaproteobacteria bacterium]
MKAPTLTVVSILIFFTTATGLTGWVGPVSADMTPSQNMAIQDFLAQKHGKIDVLNRQSYPIVGGYWTTKFVTLGTHALIITAVDGTTFRGPNSDVSFVELYDGTRKLVPVISNNKLVFPNYTSDETGYLKVKVNTAGIHNMKLEFGSDSAYTGNNAAPIATVEINDSTTGNGPDLSDLDAFGTSVTSIGDLDGDGVADIAVGAFQDDGGGIATGAIHILFMNTDGSIDSTVKINDSTVNGPDLSEGDAFGVSVANIGDLNGDGVADIAAGADFDDGGGSDRGAIHIMFMNTDGSIHATVEV